MEAIGDITASAEVSRVAVDGEEFDTRIQGGVLVRKVTTLFSILLFIRLCRVTALADSSLRYSLLHHCPSSPRYVCLPLSFPD